MTINDDTTVASSAPRSAVLHSMAGYYDLLAAFLTMGREPEFRERLAAIANITPGESVLDIGCGTGSLAFAATARVGESGTVVGVDASPEMIARARRKAARAGQAIQFEIARVEALPFADASFDVVLSTLMMHHLPRVVRERCAAEIRRVLRPGGRVLVVDFEKPSNRRGGLLARLHRHGGVPMKDIIGLLSRAELHVTDTGSVGVADLRFAVARKADRRELASPHPTLVERSFPPLPSPNWAKWAMVAILPLAIAVHLFMMQAVWIMTVAGTIVSTAVVVAVMLHLGVAGAVSRLVRRL